MNKFMVKLEGMKSKEIKTFKQLAEIVRISFLANGKSHTDIRRINLKHLGIDSEIKEIIKDFTSKNYTLTLSQYNAICDYNTKNNKVTEGIDEELNNVVMTMLESAMAKEFITFNQALELNC